MTNIGTHLSDLRSEVETLILAAVDGVHGLPPLSEQLTAIVAQRIDWRKRVAAETLAAPWVVVRYGRMEFWNEGPATVVTHVIPVEVYYVANQANENDDDLRGNLDQAVGGIIEAFRAEADTFTAVEGYTVEHGDTLDANATFLQYKMPFEAAKVTMRLMVAYP